MQPGKTMVGELDSTYPVLARGISSFSILFVFDVQQ